MKKTITLLALAFTIGAGNAQTVADFETFSLSANSSYSNTTSTPFQTSNAVFKYSYDTAYSYWNGGFAYTNHYDSSTAGYANEYGVRAYKGYSSSATYAMGQDGAQIKLKSPFNQVDGFYITNSTYAYKSMKTGDTFAKKFGGSTGNDPDYFGITVKGYYNGVLKHDTVNFYLADFRFTNNTQDYILNTWEHLNTTALGVVDSIRFYMFSSDVGNFGINTPLYFAIDNFATSTVVFQGIASNTADLNASVYPNPFNSALTVSLKDNTSSAKVNVTDVTGKAVYTETLTQKETILNLDNLQSGIYFLELSSNGQKTVKKIIKN